MNKDKKENVVDLPNRRRKRGRRYRKNNRRKQRLMIIICGVLILLAIVLGCIAWAMHRSSDTFGVKPSAENNSEAVTGESVADITTEKTEEEKAKEKVEEILNSLTLEEKINQMFFITPEALTNVGCVVAAGEQTKNALTEHPVGGIIYFSQNLTGEKQAKEMISNIKKYGNEVCKVPLFIGIDEEGGTVARLGNSDTIKVKQVESMSKIGKTKDFSKAYKAGKTIGDYLKEFGFNVDFAPVADVLTNSQNQVVKERSFSSDASVVSGMAIQFSNGLNDKGILSCYKHFPGHGATRDDTHEGLAYTDKTYDELMQSELRPFVEAINNGADFIMVGHISLPNVTGDYTPASISPIIINDILKTKLGYDGLVITDSLGMGALTNNYQADTIAIKAINAGVDVLLMPQDFEVAYNSVLNAVKSGSISEERINESVRKIISKKMQID